MSYLKFDPPLIAHRGANNIAPENTLAAFTAAKQLGANWLEFDVMLTADFEAVVIHDTHLERTTTGSGKVADINYAELSLLDAGSWFAPHFSTERVTSLRKVLDLVKHQRMSANIEIKSAINKESLVVKKVLAEIEYCWGHQVPPVLISSFSMPVLHEVRQQTRNINIGVLIDEWFPEWQTVCQNVQSVSVNLNDKLVTAEIVQQLHAMQQMVLCYTVNSPQRARTLLEWGVDALFTDNFTELLEVAKSMS